MANALGLGNYGSDEEEDGDFGILGLDSHVSDEEADKRAGEAAAARGAGSDDAECVSAGGAGRESTNAAEDEAPGHRTPHDGGADDGPLSSLPESLRLPPEGNVDPRIEDKIRQAVSRLRAGKTSFNSALRNNKIYRNPDLLTWLVEHNSMDQYGSCFDIHVFDPHGLPKEDSLQRLHAQWDREGDRKKAARAAMPAEQLRAGAGVEFQRGSGSLGIVPGSGGLPAASGMPGPAPPPGVPASGGGSGAGSVAHAMLKSTAALNAALAANKAATQAAAAAPPSKRSKWDTK